MKARKNPPRRPAPAPAQAAKGKSDSAALNPGVRTLGVVLLAVALSAVLTLSWFHFKGMHAPGCGPGSDCDLATRGRWGSIPGLKWQTSHLGSAYFLGVLLAWATSARMSCGLRNVVRLGGLVSLGFSVIMLTERLACPYCLASHGANFLFWILVETRRGSTQSGTRPLVMGATGFAVATGVLLAIEMTTRRDVAREAGRKAEESTTAIIAATSQRGFEAAATTASAPIRAFVGRYRRGPAKAAIRIVACSDFQCPSCKQVDAEIDEIFRSRKDVAISMKHFPMCNDCNPYVKPTMHANACWAARAAEAGGILRGEAGFWGMHDVLFKNSGVFLNSQQLRNMIEPLGFSFAEFEKAMKSDEALARVKSDIEECMAIGMRYTPMVLINGVEFRGWEQQGAIRAAVERIAATNPPALPFEADVVPSAAERFVHLWSTEAPKQLPDSLLRHALGPADAKIRVLLVGDFQEPSVARADGYLRQRAEAGDIRYVFAHFPFDKTCNPHVPRTEYAQDCWAANTAEAAALAGGIEGYWRVHAWLMANQTKLGPAEFAAAAESLGLLAEAVAAVAASTAVTDSVRSQIDAAKTLGLTSIPWIFVNDRPVPVWEYQGENLLPRILEAAGR